VLIPNSIRGRVAATVARFPGGALPFRLSGMGVVVRGRGQLPLFDWLLRLTPGSGPQRTIVTRAWHEESGSSVIVLFDQAAPEPRAVAKVVSPPVAFRTAPDESPALEVVAAQARIDGVDTPTLLSTGFVGGCRVVVESALRGRLAAATLAGRPRHVPVILNRIFGWLESWNRLTLVADAFAAAEIEATLRDMARFLEPQLPEFSEYEAWLHDICGKIGSGKVAAVAAHNDLTMANVLIGSRGRLGIVDWEAANERSLPLCDLFYATVDAYTAAAGYAARVEAFESCYLREGPAAEVARRHLTVFRDALGLTSAAVAACFHACWLGHAANEVARGDARNGVFLQIMQRIVRDRDVIGEALERS
jgi:hypothetical protein